MPERRPARGLPWRGGVKRFALPAAAVLIAGCGAASEQPQPGTSKLPAARTTIARTVPTSATTVPASHPPVHGTAGAHPYRFERRPIVVRWVERPGVQPLEPSYSVYFRLNRPLPTSTRKGIAVVSLNGEGSDVVSGLGYLEVPYGTCYFTIVSTNESSQPRLVHSRAGQIATVTLSIRRYGGATRTLTARAPMRKQLTNEGASDSDARRLHELGCPTKPVP